jgi:hypothetical protein
VWVDYLAQVVGLDLLWVILKKNYHQILTYQSVVVVVEEAANRLW